MGNEKAIEKRTGMNKTVHGIKLSERHFRFLDFLKSEAENGYVLLRNRDISNKTGLSNAQVKHYMYLLEAAGLVYHEYKRLGVSSIFQAICIIPDTVADHTVSIKEAVLGYIEHMYGDRDTRWQAWLEPVLGESKTQSVSNHSKTALRRLLDERGWSTQRLAEVSHLSRRTLEPYVSSLSSFRNARAWILIAVADALQVDPHLLLENNTQGRGFHEPKNSQTPNQEEP